MKSAVAEPVSTPLIVVDSFGLQMLRAVELDDEFSRETNEVDDIGTDRGLAAEFVAAEFLGTKKVPEAFFGVGGIVAKCAGEVALSLIAVHGVWFTPYLFLDASGRGNQKTPSPTLPGYGEGAGSLIPWWREAAV